VELVIHHLSPPFWPGAAHHRSRRKNEPARDYRIVKKKKLVKALNASIQLCNIREQQVGELLTDLEASRRAHLSMCGEWERAAKEVERLRAVLFKISTHDLDGADPLIDCTLRQWAHEALREK